MQIPDCFHRGGPNRDFMCSTKDGNMFYCECCSHSENSINCLSRATNHGVIVDSNELSILDLKNGVRTEDGILIKQKNMSSLFDSCKDQKYSELVCTIDAKDPETTHCVCTDYNSKNDGFDFNSKSIWDKIRQNSYETQDNSMIYQFLSDENYCCILLLMLITFILLTLFVLRFVYTKKCFNFYGSIKKKKHQKKSYVLLMQSTSSSDEDELFEDKKNQYTYTDDPPAYTDI